MPDNILKRSFTLMGLSVALTALSMSPAFAGAADDLFGSTSPIQKIVDFMTGPLAFMVVVIGIIVMGGMLIFGNDLSGFGRRIMLLVLGGGLVLGAVQVVGTLFSSTSGASYELHDLPEYSTPLPATELTGAKRP